MLQAMVFLYALTWIFTYESRWKTRTMFWSLWFIDLFVFAFGASTPIPFGLHFLMAVIGLLSPVFLVQCHTSPFRD